MAHRIVGRPETMELHFSECENRLVQELNWGVHGSPAISLCSPAEIGDDYCRGRGHVTYRI